MNSRFLLLTSAAALALASCSDNKTETTETTTTPSGAEVTTTTTTTVDTLAYRSPAQVLANQVATDLSGADTTLRVKLRPIFYTRARTISRIEAMTDTTGRYATIRAANDQASAAVRAAVGAPQYTTYTTKEAGYYNGPYTVTTVTTAAPPRPSLTRGIGEGSGVKKKESDSEDSKVKFNNGAKVKRGSDGSVKIKRADGTKIKIDENGNRTVKKGLF